MMAIPDEPGGDGPAPPSDTQIAAQREQILSRIAQLFRCSGNDPTMQALRRAVEEFRLGRLP